MQSIKRDALELLVQGCQVSRLDSGLAIFANHKLAKRYLHALHDYVVERNSDRLNLIKIRAVLA